MRNKQNGADKTATPDISVSKIICLAAALQRFLKTPGRSPYLFLLLSFVAGGICSFAMAPHNLWPLLFAGFSGVYLLLAHARTAAHTFGIGWMFGFGYHLFGLSWIGNALLVEGNSFRWAYPLALCGIPSLLAFYSALAALLTRARNLRTFSGFILFTTAFSFSEWARGHLFTGFPWNLAGYTWSNSGSISQIVALSGIYGLTALTITAAAVPAYLWLSRKQSGPALLTALFTCIFLAGGYFYGKARLANPLYTLAESETLLLVIQPNIPQSQKWNQQQLYDNYSAHVNLMRQATRHLALSGPEGKTSQRKPYRDRDTAELSHFSSEHNGLTPTSYNNDFQRNSIRHTFVIWPETAINPKIFRALVSPTRVARFLSSLPGESMLIAGALKQTADSSSSGQNQTKTDNILETVYQNENYSYYNSLLIWNAQDRIEYVYDKHHLVPFGEYVPLSNLLKFTSVTGFTGMKAGQGPFVIDPGVAPSFSPLICYEAIFPALTGHLVKERPQWLVNVTNDAWYGDSSGPYQHLDQASFRAIEQGLPLVRAANTGISAVIDPYGRILDKIAYNRAGFIAVRLPAPLPAGTLYSRYADRPFLFLLFTILAALLIFSSGVSCAITKIRTKLRCNE